MNKVKTFSEVKKGDVIYTLVEFRNTDGFVEEIKPFLMRVVNVDILPNNSTVLFFGNNPLNVFQITVPDHCVDRCFAFADGRLWITDKNLCYNEIEKQYKFNIDIVETTIKKANNLLENLKKNIKGIKR